MCAQMRGAVRAKCNPAAGRGYIIDSSENTCVSAAICIDTCVFPYLVFNGRPTLTSALDRWSLQPFLAAEPSAVSIGYSHPRP